jgi:hypothetical protein
VIDRERLRVRLLDVLAVFVPRDVAEEDHRLEGWLDRLMEADLEPAEVERLNARVAELKVAFDLEKDAYRDLEQELGEARDALRFRLQRDAHIVSVEAAVADYRRRFAALTALCQDAERRRAYVVARPKVEAILAGVSGR